MFYSKVSKNVNYKSENNGKNFIYTKYHLPREAQKSYSLSLFLFLSVSFSLSLSLYLSLSQFPPSQIYV